MAFEDSLYPLLKRYMGAPQWVKSLAGNVYASLPKRILLGKGYERFVQEAALRDPAQIDHLARVKLLETLTWAMETVPAYKKQAALLQEGLSVPELLQRFPVIGKEDIKNATDQYLSSGISARERMTMFTGGSTAAPMRFYLQRNVSRPKEHAYVDECFRLVGLSTGDVTLSLRGRTVATAGKDKGKLWIYEPIKRHLMLSSDHLEARYMPSYVAALRQWRPSVIHAFPSALYPLARWLYDHPSPDITNRFKGVLLTSENVYDFQMELFSEVFPCPVIRHYGHSERVLMASAVPGDDRYFFWPLYGWLELLDPDGRAVTEPGQIGEIVGTSFDNQVMPFIRYRTGDFAVLGTGINSEFQGYPVCERIEGRLQEFVVCNDRRLVSITTLGAAHLGELADVDSIQYEQHTPGLLLLKYQAAEELSPVACAEIVQAIRAKTQSGCTVEIRRVGSIPRTERGKHKMIVQHLDITGYLGASTVE